MKTFITLSALLLSLSLTAQFTYNNPDNSSTSGIESESNLASGVHSFSVGHINVSSGDYSTTFGGGNVASGVYSFAAGQLSNATGTLSTAIGGQVTASGGFSTSMGYQATASGEVSTAIGGGTSAIGDYSTAMGINTAASGLYSTALNGDTQAEGDYSLAAGASSIASGGASTALGNYTTAKGDFSTTIGNSTIANDYASTVIGQYNLLGSALSDNETTFNTGSPAFVIGNGTFNNRSDAVTVLFDGTTTILGSVSAPAFIGDGSQLTNLPTIDYPLSFNNTSLTGIESDGANASGLRSFAIGDNANSLSEESFSFGESVFASGDNSFAFGQFNEASGVLSIAIGSQITSSAQSSTAFGYATEASGTYSTAMGALTTASANSSTAMGTSTEASGDHSTAMGASTKASGIASTAMGLNTTADDLLCFAIGVHNKTDETPNPENFSYQNTAFVIGNGGFDSQGNYVGTSDTFSNAFEVLFDGTTTIAGDLSINSDARLKANIISLGSTLAKVLQIDGKSYTMKKDENKKQKIGVLAQDIEKVFPELVSESNGIKSVNYQGLVPVLINALKEQQTEIDTYRDEVSELKEIVQALISKE